MPNMEMQFSRNKRVMGWKQGFLLLFTAKEILGRMQNYASNIDLKVLASTLIMAQLSEIDTILYYSYSAINVNTKAKLLFNASREEKPSIL